MAGRLALLTTVATAGAVAALAPAAASADVPPDWQPLPVVPGVGTGAGAQPENPGDPPAATRKARPRLIRLSNERTFTRWAEVVQTGPIYAAPRHKARRVARLRYSTEDGFPEVYLLLVEKRDAHGVMWVKLRVPGRPNGRVGWIPRGWLDTMHMTHQALVLRRHTLRLTLYVKGRRRWSAPVGIGKRSTPTPTGRFWIRERFKISNRRSGYWPYAMGTADYSTLTDWPGGGIVGIHGPYGPESAIPGRISHGCVRLRRRDAGWLGRHVQIGAPLRIL